MKLVIRWSDVVYWVECLIVANVANRWLLPVIGTCVVSRQVLLLAVIHERNFELSQLIFEALWAVSSRFRQVVRIVVRPRLIAVPAIVDTGLVVVKISLIGVSTVLLSEKDEVSPGQGPSFPWVAL